MVTMKDVAKESGFSVATVSAVINGDAIVSQKAKKEILKAIDELGYRPNAIARSLKSTKTSSIGIIVRDITNPFYPSIVSGLEKVAWSNNYEVFLCNTENSIERERKYIDNLIEKRVDGIAITTAPISRHDYYEKLQVHGIPYLFLNRRPDELKPHEMFVGVDNKVASKKVVNHLSKSGYTKIVKIAGPQSLSTFRDRLHGFMEGMESNNLTVEEKSILVGPFSKERGYQETKKMIENNSLPEVIFCSSDTLAFGVYLALKDAGLTVSEDVAIIGIDNNPFADLIDLSTVDLCNNKMGEIAGNFLINTIQNEPIEVNTNSCLLEPQLVIRKSCGVT